MNFLIYILSVLGILLFICALNYLDKLKNRSILKAIKNTFIELQRKAIDNVISEKSIESDFHLPLDLTVTIKNKLRLIYTVDEGKEGFLHTISSQIKDEEDRDFHVECMLYIMMILHYELEMIDINQEDAAIQFDGSEFGTLFLELFLTQGEHNRFSKKIKGVLPEIPSPASSADVHDYMSQKSKKKKNKPSYVWAEPECETIKKEFTVENLRYLLEDGTKESNPEYTHQQIADWCRLWNVEIDNDRLDPPEEIRDLLLDIDMQWDMNLFNTYTLDELKKLDLTQLKLPYEWFKKWREKLENYTEKAARL